MPPRKKRCIDTEDLFDQVYPVRRPASSEFRTMDMSTTLCRAMSKALKECGDSREVVAAKMAERLGQPNFSKAMLDAYTAESKITHEITLIRFIALVQVTGATWLMDVVSEECGGTFLDGEEALLAQRGLIRQRIEELQKQESLLKKQAPVIVRKRGA